MDRACETENQTGHAQKEMQEENSLSIQQNIDQSVTICPRLGKELPKRLYVTMSGADIGPGIITFY